MVVQFMEGSIVSLKYYVKYFYRFSIIFLWIPRFMAYIDSISAFFISKSKENSQKFP